MSSDFDYVYDDANRLIEMEEIEYTWDDNGNLLDDGVNSYSYDSANRLIEVSDQLSVSSYTYNGLGDRLTQTVNENTTNYTLDLASGLTQVLYDGDNFYTYGIGRISQLELYGNTPEYFITDALGSVRQLTHESSSVLMTQSYDPYGNVVSSAGSVDSIYGYTGEQTDATGNIYLRARYYNPTDGRFISRDTWSGVENQPITFNKWTYANANPIMHTDPTGFYAYRNDINPQNAGNPIFRCLAVLAALATVDGPLPAGDIAGIAYCLALLGIASLPYTTSPEQIQEVLEECKITWERLLDNVAENPNPNKEPTPKPIESVQPIPPRVPVGTPQPTPSKEHKHISLGRWEYLGAFTVHLNIALKPQNTKVYMWGDWFSAGLSDVGANMMNETFHIAFEQAINRAERIHFNLQGITNPREWAEKYGKGSVYSAEYVTAWELYNIYHNSSALSKTIFYPNGFTSLP